MDRKNELFQKLKPPCVALGQAALALHGSKGNIKLATDHLTTIRHILSSAQSASTDVLDARLAEYVFFPIAQLLKASQRLSIRCLELSVQCIAILIDQGWRQDMPPKLAAQVAILCSLLGEREPKGLSFSESTDELQASSFWCLYHLFSVVAEHSETQKLLTSESQFPQLGQTISGILDGIDDGGSVEVQISATSALDALVVNVTDREIQASFLPGIVSKLTRVLTPKTKLRRNHTVLIGCLSVLGMLIRSTLGSEPFAQVENGVNGHMARPNQRVGRSIIDTQWQESAATQLKPALANVLRLKSHARDDVKDAIAELCLILLRECSKTLANCARMALEVLVTINATRPENAHGDQLRMLVRTDGATKASLQDLLFDWIQSLTTIMQRSDEQPKISKLEHIATAYGLVVDGGADTNMLDRTLANTLRDSVIVTLTASSSKEQASSFTSPIQSLDLKTFHAEKGFTEFASPLIKYRSQEDSLASIEKLVKLMNPSQASSSFTADLARHLRQSHGEAQIANFWLSLTATKTASHQQSHLDDFLDVEGETQPAYQQYLEELYSFSIAVLTDSSDEQPDSRLQALALRGLALRAQTAGQDFRYELVDTLYPVLHTLATPDDALQSDSITTLNIFTSACGYSSVRDLIVGNVDYLTNSVALKLNAFDVSPQAPQVLLMMLRLSGPSLLPYLEDMVESIFAALEDYHGYPLLVELLFKVLSVMAEEGVKAPQLAITDLRADDNDLLGLEKWLPTEIDSLAGLLRQSDAQTEVRSIETEDLEPHPQRPWKSPDQTPEKANEDSVEEDDDTDQQIDEPDPPPPAPKTYNLLFKITELTQHFLPSASPSLRTSLLALIRTTVPAIARHENSFLPLINTLWPEVVSRLDDDEPYVVASALEIVNLLCEYAGDFMRSRVLQLWPTLQEMYHTVAKDIMLSTSSSHVKALNSRLETTAMISNADFRHAVSRMQAEPVTYGDTSPRLLWPALVGLLATLVQNVQIPPHMSEEALEIVEPMLERAEIRSGFEKENADAVWLAEIRSGAVPKPPMPWIPDGVTWQFAELPA